ncbi:MAG: TonB-dependent receptor [Bacteroidales bacterium]|nr:TonB-dependent receptor [Bacteroidales bacterium]
MLDKAKLFITCIAAIIEISFAEAYAQTKTVKGSVINSQTLKPLPGVRVNVKNTASSAFSSADGFYKISIPDSVTTIEFSGFQGYTVQEIKIISDSYIDIYLTETELPKLTIEELLNIKVVTASKSHENISHAAAVISVITAEDIKMYASRDLADILDRAASTFMYGSYYLPNNMVTIRGEVTPHYCTHILILINGRPLRSSKEGYYLPVLRAFPVEAIEKIEIIRGPGSALYGSSAYAGIVNIITKKAEKQNCSASVQYGSFSTGRAQLSAGFKKNGLDITASGAFSHSKGWEYILRGAFADSLYPETNTPAVETSAGINLTATYKGFSINTFTGENHQMIGQPSQRWWYADEWYLNTRKIFADAGYTHRFGKKISSSLNVTYNYLKYWQPYDVHANDYREWGLFNDLLCELTNFIKLSDKFSLTLGGLSNTQTGHILNTETLADGTPYNVWEQPENPNPFYVVPKYNETWWSIYSNAIFKPFNFADINLGAHVNKVSRNKADIVPRIGAVFQLGLPITLKLLYGQAFRSPDFFELYSQVNGIYGNKMLKPEKISTSEIQLLFTQRTFSIAVGVFDNTQKNLIGRSLASDSLLIINGVPQPIFINSQKLSSQGGEIEAEIRVNSRIKILFSTLYHENEDSEGNKNIYGLPNLFVKGGVQYASKKGIDLGLYNMSVGKGNEFDVPFPEANPPARNFNYTTLKISTNLTKLFRLNDIPGLFLELTAFNLLNAEIYYPEYGDKNINTIPGRPGIAVYGALRLCY